LSKATEYIRHLEKRNNRLTDENHAMQSRIAAFEKLFMAGAMNGAMSPIQQPPTPLQFAQDPNQFMGNPMPTPREQPPQGMIQVPEDMKRIISAQMAVGQPYPVPPQAYHRANPALIRQQQIQQQQQQMQQQRWGNSGPYFGKLMVGSLAGLMILEAIREEEVSSDKMEGRGLFALPIHAVRYMVSGTHLHAMGYHISASQLISSLKLLLFLGTFMWVFVPSLFIPSDHKPKKTQEVGSSLERAPSLASPIHVRRQAWLTAIQTVWVPRHNFFLEAAALLLKTMKLSLRNLIGVHGYQMLTGLTEEQETARVKAWAIALDAQLAGGDVEINKSRLTLTLLASGTLPSTPLRLMLKALHIRVLLWDLGHKGLHNVIAAKLARSNWNEARQLNRIANQLRQRTTGIDDDELPEHLSALLEQDCDQVLNDQVIQRAYNLAWNLPTTKNVLVQTDGMDAVVDDNAVRSPMDAVSAWWSCQTLQRALLASLESDVDSVGVSQAIKEDVDLAIKTSPLGSGSLSRGLVARAVLIDEKRGASIASVVTAVGPLNAGDSTDKPVAGLLCPSLSCVSSPDVETSLRCAMAIGHLQRTKPCSPGLDGFRLVETIVVPSTTTNMSLLGCASAFKLMAHMFANRSGADTFTSSLERLSGSLRIWVGGAPGDRCGLEQTLRHKMVERCLTITKSVVGMEGDTGYGSMSECDDSDGC
jgi:hypothetical protein